MDKQENAVQMVTNNASNDVAMGIYGVEFPKIVWIPIASHFLDLLMKT